MCSVARYSYTNSTLRHALTGRHLELYTSLMSLACLCQRSHWLSHQCSGLFLTVVSIAGGPPFSNLIRVHRQRKDWLYLSSWIPNALLVCTNQTQMAAAVRIIRRWLQLYESYAGGCSCTNLMQVAAAVQIECRWMFQSPVSETWQVVLSSNGVAMSQTARRSRFQTSSRGLRMRLVQSHMVC